jgi:predicted transcriptional regulator
MSIMAPETTVQEVMSREFHSIGADSLAKEAVDKFSQEPTGCLVVLAGNRVVGIITQEDIVSRVTVHRVDPSKVYVRDIMSTPVITVRDDFTVNKAAEIMAQYKVNRLVVVEPGGAVAGLITTADLTSWLSKANGNLPIQEQPRPEKPSDAVGPYQ